MIIFQKGQLIQGPYYTIEDAQVAFRELVIYINEIKYYITRIINILYQLAYYN